VPSEMHYPCLHHCRGRPPAPTPSAYPGAQVDVAFEAAEALQPLPRLAFALLRSPLLAEAAGGADASAGAAGHPDAAAATRHLWAALPPGELRRAVYPALASYSDADTQARGWRRIKKCAVQRPCCR